MKDYYTILKLTPESSYQEVINSYNKFITYFNTIKHLNETEKQLLKDIKEAYFILGDYHNRRKYDNKIEGYIKPPRIDTSRTFFRPQHDYELNHDLNNRPTKLNSRKNNDNFSHISRMTQKLN